jgi:hypothetical protein
MVMPIAAQHMIIPRSTSYGVVIGLPQQRVITCTPCDQIITCACVNFIICIVSEHIIKSTARNTFSMMVPNAIAVLSSM